MDFLEDILCLLISTVTYTMAERDDFLSRKNLKLHRFSHWPIYHLQLASPLPRPQGRWKTSSLLAIYHLSFSNIYRCLPGCIANDYHHHKIPPKRHSAQKQQTHSFVDASMRSQHPWNIFVIAVACRESTNYHQDHPECLFKHDELDFTLKQRPPKHYV